MTRYWGEDAAVMGRRVLAGLDRWQVRKHRGEWCAFAPGEGMGRWPFRSWDGAYRFAREQAVSVQASLSMDAAGQVLVEEIAALARTCRVNPYRSVVRYTA